MAGTTAGLSTCQEEGGLVGSYSRLQHDARIHEIGVSEGLGSEREYTVAEVYQGSLVHYGPEERKLSKLEVTWLWRGPIAKALGLKDLVNPAVWRATINELVATTMLVFISIIAVITCLELGFQEPIVAIAVAHFFILSFMILASAPASGGHMNPGITFATMLTGFTSPTRTCLYVMAQALGSIAGASLVKSVVPPQAVARYSLGGCVLHQLLPATGTAPTSFIRRGLSARSGLVSEFCFNFALYYFCYNLAMDPKQFTVTGPLLAPFILGAVIASLVFFSGGLVTGYTGAAMNPARCFGPAVVLGRGYLWRDHWVYWVGPILAGFANAALYHSIPPHHLEVYSKKEDVFTKGKVVLQRVKSARYSRSNSASSSRNGASSSSTGVFEMGKLQRTNSTSNKMDAGFSAEATDKSLQVNLP